MVLEVKNLPANAGDARDTGLTPRSGRYPGEGNGNPLQYSCLGNPMNRGGWQATVHVVTRVGDNLVTKQQKFPSVPIFWRVFKIINGKFCGKLSLHLF